MKLRRTIDVEERQKSQQLIPLSRRPSFRTKLPCLPRSNHHRVGYDIPMRQHDPLRMTCGARAVDQEREIFCWIKLCPSESCRARGIADACEMFCHMVWISLVPHHDHPVCKYPNLLRGLSCSLDERQLCDQGPRSRVLKLEG